MHEPGATFQVRAGQLVEWLGRGQDETIGVTSLKRRVQELLRAQAKGPQEEERRKVSGDE